MRSITGWSRRLFPFIYFTVAPLLPFAFDVNSIKNFRAVVPGVIYRSATLDGLSDKDAQSLLDGSALGKPLAAVIDLRNDDEIRKGKLDRGDGADFFYSSLLDRSTMDYFGSDAPVLIHMPLLRDVNAFWEEAIGRMDPLERLGATFQTAFSGGALDRAAAKNLENGGPSELYTVMMASSPRAVASAMRSCAEESSRGAVIFHCQKGKDRTGVLGMLIQTCLGVSDTEILEAYGASGDLLGGEDSTASRNAVANGDKGGGGKGGMIDWSCFRGSPPSAMKETLEWTRRRYGSVENYLAEGSFDVEEQREFRRILLNLSSS